MSFEFSYRPIRIDSFFFIKTKLQDKTSESVIQALEGLRRKHRGRFLKMFKSITSDNGSEFSNAEAVEKMGIKYFYAHSYCSYERESNENNNKLIRRFIEKGVEIGKFSKKIKEIEKFMNDYPRKMFGGLSSNEVYKSLEKKYKILTFRVAIYKINLFESKWFIYGFFVVK